MQRLFAVLLGCSLTVPAALVLAAVPVKPNLSHRPALFKDARQALAIARAQGRHDVVLIIVTERGGAGEVARKAEQLGGNVRFRADDVDYLRVRIPMAPGFRSLNLAVATGIALGEALRQTGLFPD